MPDVRYVDATPDPRMPLTDNHSHRPPVATRDKVQRERHLIPADIALISPSLHSHRLHGETVLPFDEPAIDIEREALRTAFDSRSSPNDSVGSVHPSGISTGSVHLVPITNPTNQSVY